MASSRNCPDEEIRKEKVKTANSLMLRVLENANFSQLSIIILEEILQNL